jgi:hypothetical protein
VQQFIDVGRANIPRRHGRTKGAPQLGAAFRIANEERLAQREGGRFRKAHAPPEIRRALAISFKPAVEHVRGMLQNGLHVHGLNVDEIKACA